MLNVNIHHKLPFSLAMLNYQRIPTLAHERNSETDATHRGAMFAVFRGAPLSSIGSLDTLERIPRPPEMGRTKWCPGIWLRSYGSKMGRANLAQVHLCNSVIVVMCRAIVEVGEMFLIISFKKCLSTQVHNPVFAKAKAYPPASSNMEKGPVISDFPKNPSIYRGFSNYS